MSLSFSQVLMIFIVGALLILAYCSDINHSATYQDVVYSICGRHAQLVCSLAIAVYSYGTCITFLIIIGDQWDKCKIYLCFLPYN